MYFFKTAAALVIICSLVDSAIATEPISVPLRVLASNPNYFINGTGKAVYLTGSHTWNNLQDWGNGGSIQPIDFTAYVKMLVKHGHNFTLLWRTELPRFCGLPTVAKSPLDFSVSPQPWQRTGPGMASDGAPRFDLTKFDQSFFDRLRSRVQELNASGIYTGVYLFTGEWLSTFRCPNDGYPFTGSNNVNGIDDGGGIGSMAMTAPNDITAAQDAYVNKMIDTLNDLPNVLWIVSEEAPPSSIWWNNHLIAHVRSYESTKPQQHPVGYAVHSLDRNGRNADSVIYDSDADWVAPSVKISPTRSCGSGAPPCKVNINDSDHSYFGMWNESAEQNRAYLWKNFLSGNQVLFMDPYNIYYPREHRNLCLLPVQGVCSAPDPRWDNFRDNLGYARAYADRINLGAMLPRGKLFSNGYGLVSVSTTNAEYLGYTSTGTPLTIDLRATPGRLSLEWFNPTTGETVSGGIVAGGTHQTLRAPFASDAVVYLRNVPSNN
jgi:Putative collagen-binding domain of a collagenase